MFLLFFFVCSFFKSQAASRSWSGSCHVPHHLLVVHGLEDVVLPRAVVVAGAGLDEHHVLLHHLPVGALELHGQGGGSVGGAAAAVQAHAAELWPVGLGGGAAGDLELHGLGDSGGADALFTFLQRDGQMFLSIFHQRIRSLTKAIKEGGGGAHPDALLQLGLAWAHHTQPSLFLQATFAIVVGDPGGDAEAAALGAGAPFSSLNQAVLPHHGEVGAVGLLLPVGCGGEGWVRKPSPDNALAGADLLLKKINLPAKAEPTKLCL